MQAKKASKKVRDPRIAKPIILNFASDGKKVGLLLKELLRRNGQVVFFSFSI
jgi:hypothetical protein